MPESLTKLPKQYLLLSLLYFLFLFNKGSSSELSVDDEVEVPPHVQELVATDNSRFEDWIRQVKDFRVGLKQVT